MLTFFRAKRSSVLVWALMLLLIVGLAGFGIGVGGLGSSNVAEIGDRSISDEDYARTLQQEMRTQQLERTLTMAEARQFGLDRVVLARLVNDAALDLEARRLGLSTGDEAVRRQLASVPAFTGSDGAFDRETYRFALERAGLTPARFEAMLRREMARELVATGVQAGAALPQSASRSVLDFLGERRGFDWIRLDASHLDAPVPEPTDTELEAFHSENAARYTRPETRRITYASLTPEALAESISVPEEEVRAVYDADPARFGTPERRMLDRIGFGSMELARAAKTRLDAGETDFDTLARDRGLSPKETDQGAVTASELDEETAASVFGTAEPGIVGPVETPLGPSLYRVNAIMEASVIPFEEAREDIERERALRLAGDRIAGETGTIDDLLAGGATLEEIAAETAMEIGTIDLNSESRGPLAEDPAFLELADRAEERIETDLAQLDSGGLVTLRLEETQPPALIPLQEIRDRVAQDWKAAEAARRLAGQAEALATEIAQGAADLDAIAERLGAEKSTAAARTRSDVLPGAPPALMADIFSAEPGGTVVRTDGAGVILAHLTELVPFDPEAPENAAALENLETELERQAADDLLVLFTAAVRDAAGVTINQQRIEDTLARFQ